MLSFISANRLELIARTRAKAASRLAPLPAPEELTSSVPLFLDQLSEALEHPLSSKIESIVRGAAMHGAALLKRGYRVAQVVHDYGDIRQAITELADESSASITTEEFQILNQCLDDAIAEAVTEFSRLRECSMTAGETERVAVLAHELRNRLSAVQLAFLAIKSGRAPIAGSVSAVVTRNLHGLTALVDRALVEVRLDSGVTKLQRVHLHELIGEAEVDGTIEGNVHGVSLHVIPIDRPIDVEVDPQVLAGAIANLLQNAFKFTPAGGRVSLRTSVVGARVEIEIEDECGGLPPGKVEELFDAFQQRGRDRTGLGLGLFISRKGIEASGGAIRVRDLPGSGCVFTIDLPFLANAH